MKTLKVLILDDEFEMGVFLSESFEALGYVAKAVQSLDEFVSSYDDGYDILVIDLLLEETDGIELMRYLETRNCNSEIILISGSDTKTLYSAQRIGLSRGLTILGILNKPIRLKDIEFFLNNKKKPIKKRREDITEYPLLEKDLYDAIINKEIQVHYQPQIQIQENRIHGIEALARWSHPTLGMIPPPYFIGLSEKFSMIELLTEYVLKESLQTCKEISRIQKDIKVSVNFSAHHFKDLQLPERLHRIISDISIAPSQLVIEVTESKLFENLIDSMDILTRLSLKGIGLSIDDYGTGYSSIQQLKNVPFTELKIDQSFIREIQSNEDIKAMVENMIQLAKNLKMHVVAEGVEDEINVNLLKDLQCDIIQGYYFSKALPKDKLLEFINKY